jgi:hypothetical protein
LSILAAPEPCRECPKSLVAAIPVDTGARTSGPSIGERNNALQGTALIAFHAPPEDDDGRDVPCAHITPPEIAH